MAPCACPAGSALTSGVTPGNPLLLCILDGNFLSIIISSIKCNENELSKSIVLCTQTFEVSHLYRMSLFLFEELNSSYLSFSSSFIIFHF